MPPGLTDQNVAYSSYGLYYVSQENNNANQFVEGFNSTINPYNFGKVDGQDAEFASILNSVYKSVWDDEKQDIVGEMSIYKGEYTQSEDWKHLVSDYRQAKEDTEDKGGEILEKLFKDKREESRFGEYCENDEEDQINGTLLKFNDFQVIKQRLKLMDSYKVELNEGVFIWEVVNNDSDSNKETINQSTDQVLDFDFGASPLKIKTIVSNETEIENENKDGDYVSPLRELLDDEIRKEGNIIEQKEESQEDCLQELMGKDLNDQKGADLLETLLQLQKQHLGPFLIDYQILENTDKDNNSTLHNIEENQQKKSKKKRKNKNKNNTKNNTHPTQPPAAIIENPEQPILSHTSTTKSIDDLEHHQPNKTASNTEINEESEVQRAKRILAELEDAINNLEHPKPRKHPLITKEDDFKSGGSERIETNHSASTDFGEQSSMESGKTDQKLSRAQKKKLSKKKKQHMQSINDYIESTSAVHKIDSNYIAMLSSVLAEDPFALVKLKEVVLAQNTNELGFTEEEIQEIEEVNLELEKTMKRTMNNKNESDDSEPDSNSYQGVDSPDRMKYDEVPELKTRNMPLPEFLGEDFYKFHNDEIDTLDEPVNISEADLTAISYLEELMKNRANFLADFGVSGFGPFDEEK